MATTGTTSGTAGVTYTQADGQYFEKRQLRRSAGFWGLWGIGIAAVIARSAMGPWAGFVTGFAESI